MTNLEFHKDEFVQILKERDPCLCNYFCAIKQYDECSDCPFYKGREEDCDYYKFADWLLEEHKESIKLKQWEKDLIINCTQVEDYTEKDTVYNFWIIIGMKKKGHFKGITDTTMTVKEILDNCEVVEK